jgi:hydroxypyruvate isomerase
MQTPPPSPSLGRRDFLTALGGLGAAALLGGAAPRAFAADEIPAAPVPRPGRLKQGVCRGVFRGVKLTDEETCQAVAKAGALGIDLQAPEMFPLLKKYGLTCAMVTFPTGKTPAGATVGTIAKSFNRLEHHDTLVEIYTKRINEVADAGLTNLICFSGNREGMSDQQGLENCAIGLKRLLPLAEQRGVTLCMELLNSKVNHPDYQCDHAAWGVALCKHTGSERFKLLYDIYHMQIMEGDIIRTIQQNIAYIAHFHTAGNPGRHEFDDTQEMNYTGICRAIADTGYKGFVSHEYTPTKDPLGTLDRMLKLCEV